MAVSENKKKTSIRKKSARRDGSLSKKNSTIPALLRSAPERKFPPKIQPMLATLVDQPFDEEGWLYEAKWDGYRAVSFINKKKVEIRSRNNKDFNDKFFPVTKALQQWNINAVVDGEIVVLDENGVSNFGALQNWRSEADGKLIYYLFDILWLDGKDLTGLPLKERQAILKMHMPKNDRIKLSQAFEESGIDFFNAAKKAGLEGIIAKKADSIYNSGNRSKEWLKIKANKRQEMVIGGYTRNNNTSKLFSALLVGIYNKGKLIYTGKIGTGFNDTTQKEMIVRFKKLITQKPPFDELPNINKPSRFRPDPPHATATWLKPELVCEVSFTEMTSDGVMRHPSFEGLRIDKKAKDVVQEKARSTQKTVKEADAIKHKK